MTITHQIQTRAAQIMTDKPIRIILFCLQCSQRCRLWVCCLFHDIDMFVHCMHIRNIAKNGPKRRQTCKRSHPIGTRSWTDQICSQFVNWKYRMWPLLYVCSRKLHKIAQNVVQLQKNSNGRENKSVDKSAWVACREMVTSAIKARWVTLGLVQIKKQQIVTWKCRKYKSVIATKNSKYQKCHTVIAARRHSGDGFYN